MKLFVNKDSLGSPKNLVIQDGEFAWTSQHPPCSAYSYGFGDSPKSIEPLLSLYGIVISNIATPQEVATFRSCEFYGKPPWHLVFKKNEYSERASKICNELALALELIERHSYSGVFFRGNKVLSSLEDVFLDRGILNEYVKKFSNTTLKQYFLTTTGSISKAPVYDRVKTKTGRLTIKSGPPILTLPKETRKAYKSQFENGVILEIDFTSLEPRCASNFAGNDFEGADLYEHMRDLLGVNVKRDTVKELVISLLYGAGESRAKSILGRDMSTTAAVQTFQSIKDFFKFDLLKKKLLDEAKTGMIHNFFGRPIIVDSLQPGVLVNNFIQSTAVDISLLGFSDLILSLNKNCVKPLFIIHDALIIDTKSDYVPRIKEVAGDYYKHDKLGIFPWKIRRV